MGTVLFIKNADFSQNKIAVEKSMSSLLPDIPTPTPTPTPTPPTPTEEFITIEKNLSDLSTGYFDSLNTEYNTDKLIISTVYDNSESGVVKAGSVFSIYSDGLTIATIFQGMSDSPGYLIRIGNPNSTDSRDTGRLIASTENPGYYEYAFTKDVSNITRIQIAISSSATYVKAIIKLKK